MPKNNSLNGIHAQRLKQIRKFVNFDYDLREPLTRYQKDKIRKYHSEIEALTARPYHAYRARKPENLKKAQQFAQHEKHLPGLKVAFVPTDGEHKPRIRFDKNGEISAATEHVITRNLSLDINELISDPVSHVNDVIGEMPDAKQFTVQAGRYEIPIPHTRATIGNFVAKLTGRYSDDQANNYFGNWLHGINAHNFKKQSSFDDYNSAKNANKKRLQRERKNAKARARRAKNK